MWNAKFEVLRAKLLEPDGLARKKELKGSGEWSRGEPHDALQLVTYTFTVQPSSFPKPHSRADEDDFVVVDVLIETLAKRLDEVVDVSLRLQVARGHFLVDGEGL